MCLLISGGVIIIFCFLCLCFYMFRKKMKSNMKEQKHMSEQNVSMELQRIQSMSDATSDITVGIGIIMNTSTDGEIMNTPNYLWY